MIRKASYRLYNTRRKKDMLQKLAFKWLGTYKIYYVIKEKGIYLLEELNRLHLAGIFAGDCFKKFYPKQQLHYNHMPDLDQEGVPTLEDFLGTNDNTFFDILDNFSNF